MAHPYYTNFGPPQIYSQQTPMMGQVGGPSGYMPIYAPPAASYAPVQTPFIPPGAMTETPPPTRSQPLATKNRPKRSGRSATAPFPLKSAMKKPGGTEVAAAPVPAPYAEPVQARRRTNSKIKPDDMYAAMNGPATNSEAYHMFVTFKGDGELLLENTLDKARPDIQQVIAMWPHGAETQFRGSTWSIRFRNSPWNMSGPDVEIAWSLIVALFTLFSSRGFSFTTSTKCTTMQPRLIFQITNADPSSTFFLAYFSRGGRRVSLIKPPYSIAVAFGPKLKALLSNRAEVSQDKGMINVEIKRDVGGTGVQPSHFLMQVLKVMVDMGFNLDATVPMARGGPLGMGPRRELFVFKGVIPTG